MTALANRTSRSVRRMPSGGAFPLHDDTTHTHQSLDDVKPYAAPRRFGVELRLGAGVPNFRIASLAASWVNPLPHLAPPLTRPRDDTGRIEAPLWRPHRKMEDQMNIPTHSCFTGRNRGEGKKAYWARVGSAWTNRDGSFTVRLDALPMNGEIVIRPRKDEAE